MELSGGLNFGFMVVVLLLLYIDDNAQVAINRIVKFRGARGGLIRNKCRIEQGNLEL